MPNALESLDDTPRPPKQTNVRLSSAALDHLTALKQYYGLRNTTALLTFLLGDAVHRLNAQPVQRSGQRSVQPLTSALPSVDDLDDEDDLDTQRFGRQVAQQNRIDEQRSESR